MRWRRNDLSCHEETSQFHSGGRACGDATLLPIRRKTPVTSPSDGIYAPLCQDQYSLLSSLSTSRTAQHQCIHEVFLLSYRPEILRTSGFLSPGRSIAYATLSEATFFSSACILPSSLAPGWHMYCLEVLPQSPSYPAEHLA